jgi:Acyltransferase family/Prokaryotic phospholipase A2
LVRLPRLRWVVVALLTAAAFAVIASRPGAAPPPSKPTGEVAKAEQTINDLLAPRSGRDPIADMPADFATVIGHAPVRVQAPDGTTRAIHTGGGCSSPWGDDNTRWDYSVGCKAHDFGYDLLRYADAKGQPLAPELRERLDDRLSADMHAMCDINPRGSAGVCQVVASLYSVGLVVNSWHQRWGPPRSEPIGPWAFGLIVIALLIAAGVPTLTRTRRRPPPAAPKLSPTEQAQARYLGFLRILSLTGIVLAESILALASWGPAQAGWVWPLTWVLQLVPLFFLTGGQANLLAWRAAGSYPTFLTGRIAWLIRPVLAFVIAWLVVPLSLELLRAPEEAIAAFGRIVLQPLWLLGLYLLVVAALPAMYRLHQRFPVATPLALLAGTIAIGIAGRGSLAAHAGGIVIALLFQQLAFHYADGRLWRIPRPALVTLAAAGLLGLIALTTAGGYSKLLIAEPTEYASFAPSLIGMLLVGLIQVCLVSLPQERGVRAIAGSAVTRGVALVRAAPVTTYLFYLCAMLLLAGVIAAARTAGLPNHGTDWLTQPRRIFALALIGVPTLLAFLLVERRSSAPVDPVDEPELEPTGPDAAQLDALAAALGVAYAALGILGFTATGITGSSQPPAVFGLPLDPMGNLIHLLLGWYLLHCVRIGTSTRPWPWLLTAIACLGPMVTMVSGPGMALHGATMVVAIGIAMWRLQRQRVLVPEGTQ